MPQEFHRYLIEGESSRNVGDYDIKPGFSESEAAEQIEHTEKFLELAKHQIGSFSDQEEKD